MIKHYYYDNQLRKYMMQFAGIFTGMQYKTGVGADGAEPELRSVPIRYGSSDRVVSAIKAKNTQNTPLALPLMSTYLTNIEIARERIKGRRHVDQRVTAEFDGVNANRSVVKRIMPVPYNLTAELSLYASSTDEMFQILEQILLIFDPDIDIQKSDDVYDWTKISKVTLLSINNEENYPMGSERQVVVWTLSFEIEAWLSLPAVEKDNLVEKIILNVGEMSTMDTNSYGSDGEPDFFQDLFFTQEYTPD